MTVEMAEDLFSIAGDFESRPVSKNIKNIRAAINR